MAILEPKLEVIKRQKVQPTEGEWTLLNFLLENLDDTYEIYYQPFLNGDNPDFAIMRKGSGVLIIEVKDWNLDHYYCDERTKWRLHKNNAFIKSPLKQVEAYKENLFQLHSEELHQRRTKNKNSWATVSCAVYFHKSTENELKSFLLDDFKDDRYSGYKKFVSYFGLLGNNSLNINSLNNLLSRFWLNKKSYYFDEILYKSIKRYLKSPLHQIEDGLKIIYTKEQQELIRSEIRPRRKIKGVAGSGKTLVLAKRAVNAHIRTGQKILILTYNLSLKNYIHDRISDVREEFYWSNFYITNYHQFFKTQANNYNLELDSISNWQDVTFFDTVISELHKYDAIFIDEIQDYLQEWIDIITKYFTHKETEFVVFGDEKQNIYNRVLDENNEPIVRTIPGVWNKSLNTSHRFLSNIGNIAIKFQKTIFNQKYSLDEINVMSQFDFERRIIEYHSFNSYNAESLFQIVYEVLERNEIHSSDAGVLCSKVELLREIDLLIRTKKKEKTATTFESQEEYEKIKGNSKAIDKLRRTKKNHFWMKTGTMKLSTTHSFKGWEINTLFLIIEKEENDKEFTNAELIYTALTRAKRDLIIFNLGNKKYENFFMNEIQNCYFHPENIDSSIPSSFLISHRSYLIRLFSTHFDFTGYDLANLKGFVTLGNEYESYASNLVRYYPKGGLIYNKYIFWTKEIVAVYKQERILVWAGEGTDEYSGIIDFNNYPAEKLDKLGLVNDVVYYDILAEQGEFDEINKLEDEKNRLLNYEKENKTFGIEEITKAIQNEDEDYIFLETFYQSVLKTVLKKNFNIINYLKETPYNSV